MSESIDITCQDGYQLSGTFFAGHADKHQPTPILIAPATGIVQQFYKSFSLWLSEQGYDVLCFDFRGIGASLHGPLKQSKASIQTWGLQDLPAAIETLLTKTNAENITLIGHSAGGQLLGLAENYSRVKQVIAIAGSSGHVKGLSGRAKKLSPLMFQFIFPLSNLFLGYGASKILGMGENLPKGVAQQWIEFCSKPGYVINAIGKTTDVDFHADICCPITSIAATDDDIATEENVKDFLRTYPNAQTNMLIITPEKYAHKTIGHMLMLRTSHKNIWPLILEQIQH